MRISSGMYYKNIYSDGGTKLDNALFSVNKQISSGLKIEYAHEDVRAFSETMRLDNEVAIIGQNKQSAESGYKVSNQTDTVLNDFEDSLERMKNLLIQATNATQNGTSLDAVAKELRGVESHLKNLANTSINGQYIFSGSAINTKPINDSGKYQGNDDALSALVSSNTKQQYNLSGAELFLGEESQVSREIVTNVPQYNMIEKYPQLKNEPTATGKNTPITTSSTIRDLMGDLDSTIDTENSKHHFYIRGVSSDGTAFDRQISMRDDEKVDSLLTKIGEAFGNSATVSVVNVTLNSQGEIVVEDKMKGSSKLDFHMVGATDFEYDGSPSTIDKADINNPNAYQIENLGDIENLATGESDFSKIITNTSTSVYSKLHVKSFVSSELTPSQPFTNLLTKAEFTMSSSPTLGDTLTLTIGDKNGGSLTYTQPFNVDAATTYNDLRRQLESIGDFSVSISGDTIKLETTSKGLAKGVFIADALANDNLAISVVATSSNKQIDQNMKDLVYDKTSFTKNGSTLSSNVAQILRETNGFATPSTKLSEVADISQTSANTLNNTKFKLTGKDVNGTPFDVEIHLKNSLSGGSTFSYDANNDGIYNDQTYSIFDMSTPRVAVDGDNMTYQQLLDVVNMVTTNTLPVSNTEAAYDSAIEDSLLKGSTYLNDSGIIEFKDVNSTNTKASLSLHDANSGNFSSVASPSVMSFNSNNALSIRDPKTDFFKTIDAMIKSVEEGKVYADASNGDARGIGMQDALKMIDDLSMHVSKSHSKVGSNSNALNTSVERLELLQISTMTLRSSVIDTDLAEAQLTLSQLKLNYEAMYSAVGKISKLSLVNYL